MIASIVWGGTETDRAAFIEKECVNPRTVVTRISAGKASITIAQIHELIASLTLTSEKDRVIVIDNAQVMTIPAQNALLKTLEEPPTRTRFILSVPTKNALVATIISRCRLVEVKSTDEETDGQELSVIKIAFVSTAGQRIAQADSLGRKKDELVAWTGRCLADINRKMRYENKEKSLKILTEIGEIIHQAHLDLKANVSPTLAMQNLFLSLPHIGG